MLRKKDNFFQYVCYIQNSQLPLRKGILTPSDEIIFPASYKFLIWLKSNVLGLDFLLYNWVFLLLLCIIICNF